MLLEEILSHVTLTKKMQIMRSIEYEKKDIFRSCPFFPDSDKNGGKLTLSF